MTNEQKLDKVLKLLLEIDVNELERLSPEQKEEAKILLEQISANMEKIKAGK